MAGSLPARWIGEARRLWRRRRARRLFLSTCLFDAAWYAAAYPDVAASGLDPMDHYLQHGAAEGRRPNPIFDSAWYLARHPDVAASGQNPLVHFILTGSAEGRDPNPFFSTKWYVANNPAAAAFPTALSHYLVEGAAAGRDPSPRFDTHWYAENNPDAAETGLSPFAHFLLVGRMQGRAPTALGAGAYRGEPVDAARITPFKALEPVADSPVALMVAHCPHGELKPNVAPYVAGLVRAGLKVVLIAAADQPFTPDPVVTDLISGGFVRENRGYDFAAWAHALRCEPSLYAASTLLLVNDSLIGPTDQAALEALLDAVARSPADLVGATDSWEHVWHLQSFFLALKRRVLTSYALRRFFDDVRSLDDKDHVIRAYELTLTERMQVAGFDCRPLFASPDDSNPTIWGWRALLERGFPFVKTLTLRGAFPGTDLEGWRETLAAAGFDATVAQATIAASERPAERPGAGDWPLLRPPACPPRPREPWKVAYIGPWNYASGLGEASRGCLSALWRTGFRLNIHPIEIPFHFHARTAPTVDATEFDGPADAVIVHLNPDARHLLSEAQLRIVDRARKRVGIVVWEMERLPEAWIAPMRRLDAVWAPSRYCAEAFRADLTAPVEVIPHVTPVAPPLAPERRAAALKSLGLPPDARVVLYVFDGSSYLVRKNPDALVRAFAAAGLGRDDWRLVLKTKHLGERGAALRALTEATPGAQLIDAPLPRSAMQHLWAAADVYASPHRSEGFGLTIAEAMAMGKLVVATDYGGPRDFLDADCGFPVPARSQRMERSDGHYLKGGAWGEPDEAALAGALRQAADRVDTGDLALGERARDRVAERLSADAVGAAMKAALTRLLAQDAAEAA